VSVRLPTYRTRQKPSMATGDHPSNLPSRGGLRTTHIWAPPSRTRGTPPPQIPGLTAKMAYPSKCTGIETNQQKRPQRNADAAKMVLTFHEFLSIPNGLKGRVLNNGY